MRWILFAVIVIIAQFNFAQGWMPQGARSAAVGNTSVTFEDAFAYHHNPGALGFMQQPSIAVNYEARFLLRELQSQGFAYAQPLKTGVLSVGGQFYGYETFRTNRIGLGYSMPLSDNLSAGIQMNYLSLRLDPAYGIKHTVTGEVGLLAKMTEDLVLGFSAVNIGRNRLSDFQDDRFSTLMRLGVGYKIIKELNLLFEIEQAVGYKPRLRGGIEYHPIDFFYFRMGVQGAPMEYSFGAGFKFDRIMIDLASHYNQILGWTPSASFVFNFAKQSYD
jgi:hypothetical protein